MFLVMRGLWKALVIALLLLAAIPLAQAQDTDSTDLDNYKLRLIGNWWFSHPSGNFGVQNSNNYFDVNKDFGFGSYSTFSGGFDYHFRHKHHFLLNVTPNWNSRTAIIQRTIEFDGQTFPIDAQVAASVNTLNIAPGYQYDIIRRDHGFFGIEVDLNLIGTTGTLNAAGSAGGQQGTIYASNTIWAPLPSVGPTFRWYPLHDSNRLSIEGSVRGMPFFGYGNYLTSRTAVTVGLTHHLSVRAGYEMGSRLSIHGTSDQIAVKLTHTGPTAGLEYTFGESPEQKPKPVSTEPSEWHVDWVPFYLWFSGLNGNVGVGGYTAPVNVGFSDVFKNLNIGWMTALDVRRKRVGLFTDLIFMSLTSKQESTPIGASFSGFDANVKELILDPEVYVRLVDSPRGSIDAIGGGRYWHMNNSLELFPVGGGASVTPGQTQNWIDPVLGARFRLNLNKGVFVDVKGDAGGFGVGSQLTYQIYSGLGKEFKKRFSVMAGYRYLYVDYANGGFLYDVHMSGALVGLGIRFK